MPIARSCVLLCACLLAGCSPFPVLNAFSPADQAQLQGDIDYGDLPRQRLDVYQPGASGVQPAPVVVFFYGGAWDSGRKEDYRFVGHTLASRGVVAVVPDYRVYPAVTFPVFVEDAAAAVAWTLDNIGRFGGSAGRVYVMGHSAGAHIAGLVALDERYLGVHGKQPGQLRGFIGLSGPYDFLPLKSRRLKRIFGDPAPADSQPINFVNPAAPPALLITGGDDTTVIPRNTLRLADRLSQTGIPVRRIVYPEVGHGRTVAAFSSLGDGLPVVEEVVRFVRSGAAP